MANYVSVMRTNYVKVKDPVKFKEFLEDNWWYGGDGLKFWGKDDGSDESFFQCGLEGTYIDGKRKRKCSVGDIDFETVLKKDGFYAFAGETFPYALTEDDDGNDIEGADKRDFFDEVSKHLCEGEVLIMQEVGSEKLKYLAGYSKAINHRGEVLEISIDDVMGLVEQKWGFKTTEPKY